MYDDEWGETEVCQPSRYESEGTGHSSGKGRGFIIPNEDNDYWSGKKSSNNWDDNDQNGFGTGDSNGFDDCGNDDFGSRQGRGGGRGGNRGRGRGGSGFGGRGSGRGGRGGNRGGFDDDRRGGRDFGNKFDDGDNEGLEKPKGEMYVPPELPTDEETIFSNGVAMGINFDKYDSIEVRVSGENPPEPIESFRQAGLRKLVLENIEKSGYTRPTPVQKHAIPIINSGRDLMACAQTGSGKTAAFAVPIIHTLLENSCELIFSTSHCEPQVVIVSPTRELTIQIYQQIVKFALHSCLKTVVAYGGTSVRHQGGKLCGGCHILVATPGRLLDFVDKGRVRFSSVRFLVLDEADRMLDMGFLPDIERMIGHESMVPQDQRQTLMFSATFPDEIQRLASKFLNNYLFLAVGIVGGACSDVEQRFYEVPVKKKMDMLQQIMKKELDAGTLDGTLLFVEMKRRADFIAAFLSENDYPTTSIHGDRLQRQREEALADFRCGRMSILVATAVAARGLDIKNVRHVVNFDMPKCIDEYVHRIGRTGRVGNRGRATSFFDPEGDAPLRADLVRILKQADQPVPEFLLCDSTRSFRPQGGNRFGGEDVRDFDDGRAFSKPSYAQAEMTEAEPEEEW